MRLKKAAALALVGAMCVATVAGCSKSSNSSSSNNAGSSNTEVKETTAQEEEKITAEITVWGPAEDQSTDNGEWLQKTCEAFNKEHANWDLTFKYGTCSESDAGKTVSQDPSASADVYFFANDQLQTLIDANAIAKLGGNTVDYVKKTNSEAIVNSVTIDGAIYGVPFTTNTWYMFYNKSLVSEDDIKSLDTMLEKAKVSFPLQNSWYIASFYAANGCTFFGNANDNEKPIDLDGDKATAVTEYLVNLKNNSNFVLDDQGSGMSGMKDGTIAAMFSGSWDYSALKDALGDNLGIATPPTAKIGGEDKQILSFAGSKAIGVNPNCKYQQVAVALALYLGNADSQKSHYETRSIVPCNTDLLAQADVQADELVTAQNATFDSTSILQPTCSHMGRWWDPAATFGTNIMNGDVTLDNAAAKTADFNTQINTDAVQ